MSATIRNLQRRVAALEEEVARLQSLATPVEIPAKKPRRRVTKPPPRTIDEVKGYVN